MAARSMRQLEFWTTIAVAGGFTIVGTLLAWVSVPPGYTHLLVRGTDRTVGLLALLLGVGLLFDAVSGLTQPSRGLRLGVHLGLAVVLGVLTTLCWIEVDRVLQSETPELGIHPGYRGAGPYVLTIGSILLAGALYRAYSGMRRDAIEDRYRSLSDG